MIFKEKPPQLAGPSEEGLKGRSIWGPFAGTAAGEGHSVHVGDVGTCKRLSSLLLPPLQRVRRFLELIARFASLLKGNQKETRSNLVESR